MNLSIPAICLVSLAVVQSPSISSSAKLEQKDEKDLQKACPTISVSCPSDVNENDLIVFTAKIDGGDPSVVPAFYWTVSTGRIIEGQGSSQIKLDLTKSGGQSPTATVSVSGYDSSCSSTASCSILLEHWDLTPKKLDWYGVLPRVKESARLNAFAVQLERQPGAQGYLVIYGGRRGFAGEAEAVGKRLRDYLTGARGIAADRIVTIDAGFKESFTVELWLVGMGASRPVLEPTVDPSDVRFNQPVK